MGKAYTIDWNLAKALRSQGLGYREIASQTGGTAVAIRSKACREGWNDVATRASEVLQQHGLGLAARTIKEQAPKLAEAWLATVQANTVKAADAFDKLPVPKNLDDFKTYEETADKHVKRGRAAFGLDDQKGGGVQVNIMAQLNQLVSATPTATVDATVVDVSPNETD